MLADNVMPVKRGEHAPSRSIEVCILSGGRSSRMGKDKARVRVAGRTLLGHVRSAALQLNSPVRVIRRDAVPKCGPLGGVITALRSTRAAAVLFLACDMPMVPVSLLKRLLSRSRSGTRPVFTEAGGQVGFPLLLPTAMLETVEAQRLAGEYSLSGLAKQVRAVRLRARAADVININTPDELERARPCFAALYRSR
jgi:molybdenum cofactor guanylyltransferase